MQNICTLFTSTKPFIGHDAITQRNALDNWRALGLRCIVMGDDAGTAEAAQKCGFQHLPEITRTKSGTPFLNDMFEKAQANAETHLVCYINADILLPPTFLTALELAARRWEKFLMVGQRWDIDVVEKMNFSKEWPEHLEAIRRKRGKLHSPWGIDYFAFPRGMVRDMPPFAIGRPCWDTWLIWTLANNGIPLLNATQGVPALHQNHAYKHVPGGSGTDYFGPEGNENLRLAAEQAPDLDTIYASTYRSEWLFDGERIRLDKSWGRWWWYTKNMDTNWGRIAGLVLRVVLWPLAWSRVWGCVCLRQIFGPKKYSALRDTYRALRGKQYRSVI